jgi:tetrahydromethanopterin S-methyltransferase subunit A
LSADGAIHEAAGQLRRAGEASKCWPCGCLHETLEGIDRNFPNGRCPSDLKQAAQSAHERLEEVRYDCLGCEECYPALAVNALDIEVAPCPTASAEEREGWPPLPGSYTVLRYQAPVAICTLIDDDLAEALAREAGPDAAIVGSMKTENLGVERLIRNVITNPHIRFLILCGEDTKQKIGHLPGQSTLALLKSGLNERQRIVGAGGKRPVIKNLPTDAVEHFRQSVQPIDLIGCADVVTILEAAQSCARQNPGPAEVFESTLQVEHIAGRVPQKMTPDPNGYFVVHVDRRGHRLVLEHYLNSGAINAIIDGLVAAELYTVAIERDLVSRLDHAAYLGQELARAERALREGEPFIQDAAPEGTQTAPSGGCGCTTQCGEQD